MSEINLETACQLFETQVTLQYQNRLKLQDTIEECHGLHGTYLNIPMSDLVDKRVTMLTKNFGRRVPEICLHHVTNIKPRPSCVRRALIPYGIHAHVSHNDLTA